MLKIEKFYKKCIKKKRFIAWRDEIYNTYSNIEKYDNWMIINEYKEHSLELEHLKKTNDDDLPKILPPIFSVVIAMITIAFNIMLYIINVSNTTVSDVIETQKSYSNVDYIETMEMMKNNFYDNMSIYDDMVTSIRGVLLILIAGILLLWLVQQLFKSYNTKKIMYYEEKVSIIADIMQARGIHKKQDSQ